MKKVLIAYNYFAIFYPLNSKPEIITEEVFDEVSQETKTKRYFTIKMQINGFGIPTDIEKPTAEPWDIIYKGNHFIMKWKSNLLYLEVPEGKDEAWCREQEFELLGNVFNVGKLADRKY